MSKASSKSWQKIFSDYGIDKHNFAKSPFVITSAQIKKSCQGFTTTGAKEVRILCKQDSREERPDIFVQKGLFLLPIKNGEFAIIEGEGYIDVPTIATAPKTYKSKLAFVPDTSKIGDSEMQHLDYAYASSLVRNFMNDTSLVLTVRGRKYTPRFSFQVGKHKHTINAESVQTEVDAGYEGANKLLLIEAKNAVTSNLIIRQLYYPFRQWQQHTQKPIELLFFEKRANDYGIWRYAFDDVNDYNSIKLVDFACYQIVD